MPLSPARIASLHLAETVGFHGYGMSPSQMRLPGPQFSDAKPIPSGDVEEAVEYLEETTPGLLVGYSRGGAVVMLALKQVDGKKPKVIYVAPAWRRGWATTSPPSTQGEILHGDEDDKVPLQHSCDLAQRTGMPLHVFPGRNHVSILKDKLNTGGGKRVPTDKLRECVQTMPDWGTGGSGSRNEVAEQVSFVEKLAHRVASKHLAYRFDLSPYDHAGKPVEDVLDDIRHMTYASPNPDLDFDFSGEQTGQAILLNRARAWSLSKFTEWLEGVAGGNLIDSLREILDAKPVLAVIKDSKGRVLWQKAVDEKGLLDLQKEMEKPYYHGQTLVTGPIAKGPIGKKLRELEQSRTQRIRDYAGIYADLRQIKVEMKVYRESNGFNTLVYDHDMISGGIQVLKLNGGLSSNCKSDLEQLIGQYGVGDVWMVFHAALHPYLRGKHIGTQMYERTIKEIGKGPAYLVANRCFTEGELTSPDALRVWQTLSRKYPTSGTVLAIP